MLHIATLVCLAHLSRATPSLAIHLPTNKKNDTYMPIGNVKFPRLIKREPSLKNLSVSNIKTSIPNVIKKFSRIRPYNKLKVCICDTQKKDCQQLVPKVEVTRQNTKNKTKKGHYKTYLDSMAEKDRKFCKTSTTEKFPTKRGEKCTRTTISSTRTTPSLCEYASTVFLGVVACPVNNAKMEYFLWVRPNRRNISVKAKCHKGKRPDAMKQVPGHKNK